MALLLRGLVFQLQSASASSVAPSLSSATIVPSSRLFSVSSVPHIGAHHRLPTPNSRASTLSELVSLNGLRDIPGSRKVARRTGRGQGSSRGKLGGYGMKGQGQKGTTPRPGFEGGQTPLYRRVEKVGFSNERASTAPLALNLSNLQAFIDRGRLDASAPITMKALYDAGLFSRIPHHGVKILADGAAWFDAKIDLYVTSVSENAKKAIERNGGRVVTVYYNQAGLRRFCMSEGPDVPGLPMPTLAHAPPAISSRFDLPRAPQSYPVEDLAQVPSATSLFKRTRHTIEFPVKFGYPDPKAASRVVMSESAKKAKSKAKSKSA